MLKSRRTLFALLFVLSPSPLSRGSAFIKVARSSSEMTSKLPPTLKNYLRSNIDGLEQSFWVNRKNAASRVTVFMNGPCAVLHPVTCALSVFEEIYVFCSHDLTNGYRCSVNDGVFVFYSATGVVSASLGQARAGPPGVPCRIFLPIPNICLSRGSGVFLYHCRWS